MSTNRPTISFYGGLNTIGGTKICISEGGYRLFFDWGSFFNPGGDFWHGRVQPRTGAAAVRDWVEMGYAPRLAGIYHAAGAASLGLPTEPDGKTAIFVSHLHLDHMRLLDLIHPDIPVYMHHESLTLFRAVAESGEQPAVPPATVGFAAGDVIEVGPMKVRPVLVDHDIAGAVALLIETSAGTIVYSGDLRTHGLHPEYTMDFVAAAKAQHPLALLIEGTRLGEPERAVDSPPPTHEGDLPEIIQAQLEACTGLALVTTYPRHVERLQNIAAAAMAAGRTLVVEPEAALQVYRTTGQLLPIYLGHRWLEAQAAGTRPAWLDELLRLSPAYTAADITAAQGEFLLQLAFPNLPELADLAPQAGSIMLHSNGEPLGRFDPAWELFERWLARFGLTLVMANCTGHASPAALHELVADIAPQVLIPIHSHNPQLLNPPGQPRILPQLGDTYYLDELTTLAKVDE